MPRWSRASQPSEESRTAALARLRALEGEAPAAVGGWVPGPDDWLDSLPAPSARPAPPSPARPTPSARSELPPPAGPPGPPVPPVAPAASASTGPSGSSGSTDRLSSRLMAMLANHLPESLRGARLDVSRGGALALAAVAVAAVAVTALLALRSRPRPVAVPAATPPVSRPSTVSAASTTPSAAPDLVVDVAGHVRRPGIVTLPPGSRVIDAVQAAGGATRPEDLAKVNLARRVVDGEQIAIGIAPAPGGPPAAGPGGSAGATAGAALDLNSATEAQLETLPGVGPVLAQRIVDWREQHGRFASVDQLRQVSGIGDAKFAEISKRVRV